MIDNVKARIAFFMVLITLVSGCSTFKEQKKTRVNQVETIQVGLSAYNSSDFKQVEVTFFTHKSKQLVFRVLSDIEKTSQWFTNVKSVDVLEIYNNQQYLLQTIINMPWPFKNRELITCVDTTFEDVTTMIDIASCSDRVPATNENLRITNIQSHWVIKEITDSLVKVTYTTWLDPEGNIPVFMFNSELKISTKNDFKKLKDLIETSSIENFSY